MQKDLTEDPRIREFTDQFTGMLQVMSKVDDPDLVRQSLAAMARAVHQSLYRDNMWKKRIASSDSLAHLASGLDRAIVSDGARDLRAEQVICLGFIGLMVDYQPERRNEIIGAFRPFERVLMAK